MEQKSIAVILIKTKGYLDWGFSSGEGKKLSKFEIYQDFRERNDQLDWGINFQPELMVVPLIEMVKLGKEQT